MLLNVINVKSLTEKIWSQFTLGKQIWNCEKKHSYHNGIGYWEILKSILLLHTTEEFIEHCQDGALFIEVWGYKKSRF